MPYADFCSNSTIKGVFTMTIGADLIADFGPTLLNVEKFIRNSDHLSIKYFYAVLLLKLSFYFLSNT